MLRRSWRTALKAAVTEQDVLGVVTRYCAEWTAPEIATLPRGAWPSRIATRGDVLSHAAVLGGLHSRFGGAPASLAGLQELLLFFTHAAVRIAKLDGGRGPEGTAAGKSEDYKPVMGRRRPSTSRSRRRTR